eukprot:TRINITY_DN20301_c0_g1::TRINITY_DN20301_c0_g1_i1::g.19725::m.19725 TRINITY_DN20301_c0_g1::TRINITY_DN20301_c0_g1_i1::g.19725  ORF type:complete len:463 (+),score=15.51,sp/Q6P7N4/HMCES_XENTR/30.88/2e-31,DUF159/PF02586.9/2.5e-46 TRINITY_DN20301_c0_g1_i1:74-1462(+)
MCGRTAMTLDPALIQKMTNAGKWVNRELYRPSYNIGPCTYNVVLRNEGGVKGEMKSENNEKVLDCMRWGLNPPWMNGPLINAKSETILEKPTFRKPMQNNQRCIILVQGFFEWKKETVKQPYFFCRDDGSLLMLAGIYENTAEGPKYLALTVPASKATSWCHDRMPSILLNQEEADRWLDKGDLTVLRPVSEGMRWYPVTRAVGSVAHNEPDCIVEIRLDESQQKRKEAGISSFFQKKEMMAEQGRPASPTRSPTKSIPRDTSTEVKKESTSTQPTIHTHTTQTLTSSPTRVKPDVKSEVKREVKSETDKKPILSPKQSIPVSPTKTTDGNTARPSVKPESDSTNPPGHTTQKKEPLVHESVDLSQDDEPVFTPPATSTEPPAHTSSSTPNRSDSVIVLDEEDPDLSRNISNVSTSSVEMVGFKRPGEDPVLSSPTKRARKLNADSAKLRPKNQPDISSFFK